uniref:PROP1-like PPR domain-containing protein n=1 Tax=Alexandrium monilatum TaxID=311494 RepID=A0A7S4QPU8_9DINO
MGRGDRSERGDAAAEKAKHDASGGRSPTSNNNVATPSRANRREAGGERTRGPTSALEDLMRRRGVDEAWSALEEMQRQGATTDKYTISRMLMKTVGDGRSKLNPPRVYRAIALVEKFIDTQPKDVDEVLFNALLDTCCRLKDLSRLEATVSRMKEFKVAASPVTLGILVKTYGQAGDIQKVLQVWGDMEKQRDQANAVTYGCMIDACVKCGHLEKAVEIFQGMRKVGKHKNTILYTTLIKGYGLEKDLAHALELFREMPEEGVPYNTITYNSILDACIKCGELATAEGLLREMTSPESSLEPDLITFSTLLKGYCHIGNLEKALQVAEAIKARGLQSDELVYNTLMDGCVKANDIRAGVGLFEEMIHSGMRPSTITHSILSKLYQHAGYEDSAEMVANLYSHHGIERPSGKGFSRRYNPRSPGRGGERSANQSPLGSPSAASTTSTLGLGGFGEGGWAALGGIPAMPGADSERSAPSTPLRSPIQGTASSAAAPYLPLESLRGLPFVPPLPGTAGPSGSPFSLASCTPAGSIPPASFPGSLAGSLVGSPCGSPQASMDQQGFHVPPSPHTMPAACGQVGAFMGATMPGVGPPQLPPWPFTCGAPLQSPCPGMTMPTMPSPLPQGGQQMFAMPVMQAPLGSPHMGVGSGAPGAFGMPGDPAQMAGPTSTVPIPPAGAAGMATAKQSPFPMPISPPHDLSYCGASGVVGQQGPQPYFDGFSIMAGQQGGGGMPLAPCASMGAGSGAAASSNQQSLLLS